MTRTEAAQWAVDVIRGMAPAARAPDGLGEEQRALLSELWARAQGEVSLSYLPQYETLEVEGVSYAYDLFRSLGILPMGSLVRLMKRENGTLQLKVEREGPGVQEEHERALEEAYQRGFNDHAAAMQEEAQDDG